MGVHHFCGIWCCLRTHKQEWCQLRPIIYHLFMTLPNNLQQITFFASTPVTVRVSHHRQSMPPALTEYAAPSVWAYMTASPPQPLNEADMKMTVHPITANLSANHNAYGDASNIATASGINNIFSFILSFFTSYFHSGRQA